MAARTRREAAPPDGWGKVSHPEEQERVLVLRLDLPVLLHQRSRHLAGHAHRLYRGSASIGIPEMFFVRIWSAAASLAMGAATFAGVAGVALLNLRFEKSVAYALPFSAGVTLYVAASDLIPEVNRTEEKNPVVSIVVFAGVALFYLLHRVIPR